MKTNVILSSSDRELFGITIKQKTENQFLCVTDLQKAYEVARWEYGWSERRIETITQTIDFKERIFYVLENQGLVKTDINVFMKKCENQGITKVLKEIGVWKMTGRGENREVVCDPYVWVLLAMEMNPMIYAKVVVWLTDSLIFNRIEAGNEFMPMNTAISSVVENPYYYIYAQLINKKVFGKHITGMRNLASSKELRKISDIEKFVTQSIEMGFLKNHENIVRAIQNYK